MQKIEELIAALEMAEGPSQEFDWTIANLILGFLAMQPKKHPYEGALAYDKDGILRLVPRYTASIDGAIALAKRVLPGWRIRAEHGENYSVTEFIRGWGARKEVLGLATSERPDDHIALCICTATLRAKLSQEKNNADK